MINTPQHQTSQKQQQYQRKELCQYYVSTQGPKCKYGKNCSFSHAEHPVYYQQKQTKQIEEEYKNDKSQPKNEFLAIRQQQQNRKLWRKRICPDMSYETLFDCINKSHCRYMHSYEEAFGIQKSLVIKDSQIQQKRGGTNLFRDLSWNITYLVLEYFTFKEIMTKVRLINKETVHFTSSRMQFVNLKDKEISIKLLQMNFIPALNHPMAKYAERATIFYSQYVEHQWFHLTNLFKVNYFQMLTSLTFKAVFIEKQPVIDEQNSVFIEMIVDMCHSSLAESLKMLEIICPNNRLHNEETFPTSHIMWTVMIKMNKLSHLKLPLGNLLIQGKQICNQLSKLNHRDCQTKQEHTKVVLDLQECSVFCLDSNSDQIRLKILKKLSKLSISHRFCKINIRQGLHEKQISSDSSNISLFSQSSNFLSNLTVLNLKGLKLQDEAINVISNCSSISNVQELILNRNALTSKCIFFIMTSKYLRSLKHLDLRKNKITSLNVFKFSNGRKLLSLKIYDEIDDSNNELREFFQSTFVQNLEFLYLRFVKKKVVSLREKLSDNFRMQKLVLQKVIFKNETCLNFLSTLKNLEVLKLYKCKIEGYDNSKCLESLINLRKLVLWNLTKIEYPTLLINSCTHLSYLKLECKNSTTIPLNSITVPSISILKCYFEESEQIQKQIVEMACFRNLITLEFPCQKIENMRLIINVKNNLRRLIIIRTAQDDIIGFLNSLSQNYKKLKKLDFLGIKYSSHLTLFTFIQLERNGKKLLDIKNLLKLKGLGFPLSHQLAPFLLNDNSNLKECVFYQTSTKYPEKHFQLFYKMEQLFCNAECKMKIKFLKKHYPYRTHKKVYEEPLDDEVEEYGRGRGRGRGWGRGRWDRGSDDDGEIIRQLSFIPDMMNHQQIPQILNYEEEYQIQYLNSLQENQDFTYDRLVSTNDLNNENQFRIPIERSAFENEEEEDEVFQIIT